MATFDGLLLEDEFPPLLLESEYPLGDLVVSSAALTASVFQFPLLGILGEPGPPATGETFDGLLCDDCFVDDLILDRIYFTPNLIDAGLIVGDSNTSIQVWNAHRVDSQTITTIDKVNVAGTLLNHGFLPVLITPDSEIFDDVDIFQVGPGVQDTIYDYILSPDVRTNTTLVITGRRLDAINNFWEHNWRQNFTMEYIHNTIVQEQEQFYEQRRPMQTKSQRRIKAFFTFKDDQFQFFQNELRIFKDQLLTVPVYSEHLTPSNDPDAGVITLFFNETLEDHYNLIERTELLLIRDFSNNEVNEILRIDTLDTGANSITFSSPLGNTYLKQKTHVYPIFLGKIRPNFKVKILTGNVAEVTVEFFEFGKDNL